MEKIKLNENECKTISGYPCIDNLMQGGIEPGIITEFYGEGGAGKSKLILTDKMVSGFCLIRGWQHIANFLNVCQL